MRIVAVPGGTLSQFRAMVLTMPFDLSLAPPPTFESPAAGCTAVVRRVYGSEIAVPYVATARRVFGAEVTVGP